MIDLNGNCNASLPEYPLHVVSASGIFFDNKIIICGGGDQSSENTFKECYQFMQGNEGFQFLHFMKEQRMYAKSILFQDYMLVTGGKNRNYTGGDSTLDTGEYIQIKNKTDEPKPDIQLPKPIEEHSFTKINQSTALLVGGYARASAARYSDLIAKILNQKCLSLLWIVGMKYVFCSAQRFLR